MHPPQQLKLCRSRIKAPIPICTVHKLDLSTTFELLQYDLSCCCGIYQWLANHWRLTIIQVLQQLQLYSSRIKAAVSNQRDHQLDLGTNNSVLQNDLHCCCGVIRWVCIQYICITHLLQQPDLYRSRIKAVVPIGNDHNLDLGTAFLLLQDDLSCCCRVDERIAIYRCFTALQVSQQPCTHWAE